MTSLGIIPAAGKATRFGGILKELLPGGGLSLMSKQVFALTHICDQVVVITTTEKIQEHARDLQCFGKVIYAIQNDKRDAWGAIVTALTYEADYYHYLYPDVYMGEINIAAYKDDFVLHLFDTDKPERFGCYREGQIYDKMLLEPPQKAYGALSWSKEVRDYWRMHDNNYDITSHTHAFNMAISQFGCNCQDTIDYYHDIASFDDYKELIKNVL